MTQALAHAFDQKAAPPPAVLDAEAYRLLLERLLGEGHGRGKTKEVAAYLLRNMTLVRPETQEVQSIEMPQLYIIMDTSCYCNEYSRSLVLRDITQQYVRKITGEGDINAPDSEWPGIWTTKKGAFEFDYARRKDENGDLLNIYDPNPEAYRICLEVTEPVTIPTQWGEPWTIDAGGTLAVRERDVKELSEALQSIRKGLATAQEALFQPAEEGKPQKTRFDVYGMMPGFLKDNYDPVAVKKSTGEIMGAYARRSTTAAAPAKKAGL